MNDGETPTSRYDVLPDGIIIQTVKVGARQEVADAEANMREFHRLAGGKKRRLLVDLRESGATGQGVREYYASQAVHLTANAIIVGSALSRMIGNFFINLNRPVAPTKLFSSRDEALSWLRATPER